MSDVTFETRLAGLSDERQKYIVSSLPIHLIAGGLLDKAADVLCDLGFIRAKCRAGMIADLLSDYSRCLEQLGSKYPGEQLNSYPLARITHSHGECASVVPNEPPGPHPVSNLESLSVHLESLSGDHVGGSLQTPLVPPKQTLPSNIMPLNNIAKAIFDVGKPDKKPKEKPNDFDMLTPIKRLHVFNSFVQKHAHLIGRNPNALIQAARNWASSGQVGEAAKKYIDAGEKLWIIRDPRPKNPDVKSPCIKVIKPSFGVVRKVAISSDATWAISGGGKLPCVWNLQDGILHRRLRGHASNVTSVALSGDASVGVSLDTSGVIIIWSPLSNNEGDILPCRTKTGTCLSITVDGTRLFLGCADGSVEIWDITSKKFIRYLRGHGDVIHDISVTSDGQLAISGSADGEARIWDVNNGACLRKLFSGTNRKEVTAVAIASNGSIAYTGHRDECVRMWDLRNGVYLRRFGKIHRSTIRSIATSPDGSLMVSGDAYRRICVWNCSTGEIKHVFDDHANPITGVALDSSGRYAISIGDDKAIRMWDLKFQGKEIRTFGHTEAVTDVDLLHESKPCEGISAISCGNDRGVRLWNALNGYCLNTLRQHQSPVWRVAFLPGGNEAISASKDGTAFVWNLRTCRVLSALKDTKKGLDHFAIHPTDNLLITVRNDGRPKIWDAKSGNPIATLPVIRSSFIGVAWISNTKEVITVSRNGKHQIWATLTGQIVNEWDSTIQQITNWAISKTGNVLALANAQNVVQIYEPHSGRLLYEYTINPARINGMLFSRDDSTFGLYDSHRKLYVWRMLHENKHQTYTFSVQDRTVTFVRLNSTGKMALCAQGDRLVYIDMINNILLSEYICESYVTTMSEVNDQWNVVCGTRLGQLHFLKLRCWDDPNYPSRSE